MYLISNYLKWIKKLCLESGSQISNGMKYAVSESILIFKKSQNIKQTNIDLARFHFLNGNILDSIFRLIIIDKFISKNDVEVKNLLGIAYYMRGKIDKAITHLSFDEKNNMEILSFLKNPSHYNEIPDKIYSLVRDSKASYYKNLFITNSYLPFLINHQDLSLEFAKYTLLVVPALEKNSDILELGCSTGFVANHIKLNAIVNLEKIVGVESSNSMLEILSQENPNLYYQTYQQILFNFITNHTGKYDLIISFCNLDNKNNLTDVFTSIFSMLKPKGFFSMALPLSPLGTTLNNTKTQFLYNEEDLNKFIHNSGFNKVKSKKITINSLTYIFWVLKNFN